MRPVNRTFRSKFPLISVSSPLRTLSENSQWELSAKFSANFQRNFHQTSTKFHPNHFTRTLSFTRSLKIKNALCFDCRRQTVSVANHSIVCRTQFLRTFWTSQSLNFTRQHSQCICESLRASPSDTRRRCLLLIRANRRQSESLRQRANVCV